MSDTLPRTAAEAAALETAGAPLKYLRFWGHAPERDGSPGRGCLSQWWPVEFEENGHRFASAEHYMMAHKAWLFGDTAAAERVLAAEHPAEAKKIGRSVKDFDLPAWESERFDIVVRGSLAKFGQHPALLDYLAGTRARVLVEASPYDRIWGIGLAADDPRAATASTWKGLNLLGFALIEARHQLTS